MFVIYENVYIGGKRQISSGWVINYQFKSSNRGIEQEDFAIEVGIWSWIAAL